VPSPPVLCLPVPNPPMLNLFPSRTTERKERDDRGRVPEPMSATTPRNTRALFRSTCGKELGLWPGTRVFVGRPAWPSSPPQFNTYTCGSTHLGVTQPAPSFFLPFGSLIVSTLVSNLKPGHWDLGPGSVRIQDLRLETR
jgi:hypothetical protein